MSVRQEKRPKKHLSLSGLSGHGKQLFRFFAYAALVLSPALALAQTNKLPDGVLSLGTLSEKDVKTSGGSAIPSAKVPELPKAETPARVEAEKSLGKLAPQDMKTALAKKKETKPSSYAPPISPTATITKTPEMPKQQAKKETESLKPPALAVATATPPSTMGYLPTPPLPPEKALPKKQEKAAPQAPNLQAPTLVAPSVKAPARGASFAQLLGIVSPKLPLDLRVSSSTQPDIMEPVRLEEAVAFALKNNFEVHAAEARRDTTKWEKWAAYGEYLPSVDATYAIGQERSRPGSFNDSNGDRVADTVHLRVDRSLTIRQPVVDLSVIADILKGHTKQELSETDEIEVREDVALNTIDVYLNLVRARMSVQLADQYRKKMDELSARMTARVEGGAATKADQERINSRSKLAEAARLEALGDYGIQLSELKRLTKVVPAQIEIPARLVPEVPATAEAAMQAALKSNAGYLSALKKVDLAEADRNKAFAMMLPKMTAQYSRIYTYNGGGAAMGNPIDDLSPKQDDERVMAVASWSLNGGTSAATGMAGVAKMREMSFKALDTRARIEQAIYTGYDALSSARKRVAILRDTLVADTKVAQDFEEQYAQGSRSLFEVLDAHERLQAARLELMRTLIAEAQAAYQVRRQMGELATAVLTGAAKVGS